MRKMTMGELMAKHAQPQQARPQAQPARIPSDTNKTLPPLPLEASQAPKSSSPIRPNLAPPAGRGRKRKSSHIEIASDGDHDAAFSSAPESLPVAKKTRGKAAGTGTRAASRTVKPANVLSPRSHNSRTLPRSPVKDHTTSPLKPTSPTKSYIARPISPLKPASPLKSAASAATSAISAAAHGMMEHAKRGAANAGKLSRQASREKTATATTAATTAAAGKGRMLPPPRPVPSAPSSPQRTTSASSNVTSASDMSTASTNTTVITKPKRGRAAKTTVGKSSPVAAKKAAMKTAATTTKAAGAGALKSNAKGANKKVVVAEPAAGRRVLRKRN